mmetsp:Transcript_38402/g.95395  ORF Transcript_38402/g.95395 Transcript_38402/m.95395 type:complete len:211 (+) Transcript_38402:878-1510(+)
MGWCGGGGSTSLNWMGCGERQLRRDGACRRGAGSGALFLADAALHGAGVHGARRLHTRRVSHDVASRVRRHRAAARSGGGSELHLHASAGRGGGGSRAHHATLRVRGCSAGPTDGAFGGVVLPTADNGWRSANVLRKPSLPSGVPGAVLLSPGAPGTRRRGHSDDPVADRVGGARQVRGAAGGDVPGAVSISASALLARQMPAQGGVRGK